MCTLSELCSKLLEWFFTQFAYSFAVCMNILFFQNMLTNISYSVRKSMQMHYWINGIFIWQCCVNGLYVTVRHSTLLSKIADLTIDHQLYNWIVVFLSDRQYVIKHNGKSTVALNINCSIVQGSGLGPIMYIDLHPICPTYWNMLMTHT